ncbi:hypothetical protein ASZ78_015796 [Callipepla squamata]|uniref:Uncharacterized protein n=1 Tax=Callipepla squamata TaxID=9009 RepID=A0A226NHJ9_CALSU|nr:hypothetical protein ASZ78_015796 [Callipepla squamata]
MFCKAFRVRAGTAIRGSERRKLRAEVAAAFPRLSAEQLAELIPSKEELNVIKIHTHKGEAVTVYTNSRNPVLFEIEKALYPTDLMLPGVVVPSSGFPQVERGTLCAVTLLGNRAPVAVAAAAMSTAEMLAAGMKGKGFAVLHTYMDHLWEYGDKSCPPTLAPMVADPAEEENAESEEEVEGKKLGNSCSTDTLQHVDIGDLSLKEQNSCAVVMGKEELDENRAAETAEDDSTGAQQDAENSRTPQEQMDALFNQCFFHALKCKVKKSDLPLLTSTFLRSHMFSCWYVFSKFLQSMQHQKVLQVKELTKGVESIVEVDWKHPEKGSILSSSEVRNIIVNYVKANELVDETNKNFVKVNAILCDCLLDKSEQDEISHLKWDDLLSRCLERLQPLHQVTFFGQEPIVRKGNIEPIDITTAQRASNKKVTIIKNLELYGLDPQCVASVLQQKVQASTTITPVPGAKDRVQVQIQGNQIHHLAKMLLEEYQLPRKYIQGLEKAPKLGRKK